MTREETSQERAEFEAALEQADALLSPPLPREVIARVLVAHAEATRVRDEAEADLGQVAVALGLAKDSPATSVIECAAHENRAAVNLRRTLERVAEAAGVDTARDADHIADRATSVIKELREELNRRVAAATSTSPTVDELLATAPVGSIIECERDEPGKFAQIKIVPGRIWRRRSWANGAWWSWGDVSVLEIDVLKRRACLVTAAEAAADPASRWNGGGS